MSQNCFLSVHIKKKDMKKMQSILILPNTVEH